MKTGNDFRREFKEAEHGFRHAVDDALDGLTEECDSRAFRAPRLAIVLVVTLLLLGSAAVAATVHRSNIQDFTDRSQWANLTDEARRVLMTDFPDVVIDNPYADMVIAEAVYDGMAVYVLVEVAPKNETTFMIPSHLFEDNQAVSYGSSYPKDMSIQQYAEQLGYQDVISMQGRCSETPGQYYDSARNEDGSFSLMMCSMFADLMRK